MAKVPGQGRTENKPDMNPAPLAEEFDFRINVSQRANGDLDMSIENITTDRESLLRIAFKLEQLVCQLRKVCMNS